MNSITWRGVSSTTIDGLLICELPPISKPTMRIKETVIDGRDGSFVEELGYSSYEKPILIGLHGKYDIDKVIKYFTGEGDLVFSNEPDKVYKARVVANIDFQRLVRYRTASVTFLVQPYKYKKDEAMKETEIVVKSGTSIVVNDSGNATIKSIVVGDGSKTEGQTEIVAIGKNLLPLPYFQSTTMHNGVSYTVNADGSVKVKGKANGFSNLILAKELEFEDGESYALSGETSNVSLIFCYKDAKGISQYTRRVIWSNEYTFVQIYIQVNDGLTADGVIYPMLETGLSASSFVPYQKSIATYDYAKKTMSNRLQTFYPRTTITSKDGASMDIEYFKPFEVFNEGLESSRPLMILKGSGTVEISVNDVGIFTYTFPEGENEVYIDSEKEDAYLGSALKNRNMNGEFPILLPKTNRIEWSGDVESIEILPKSRWL